MTTMVSASDPTISQPLEGIPLNQFAATLEHIRVRLARCEARLDERDRWAAAVRPAATLPPLRPEPDPPDGPLLYPTAQPQFQFSPHFQFSPPTSDPTSVSLLHQTDRLLPPYTHQQPPRPNANSCWYQTNPPKQLQQGQSLPPSCWEPPYQRQQFSWPTYDQPTAWTPSCWGLLAHRAPQEHPAYDQPPPQPPTCWQPEYQPLQSLPRSDCPLQPPLPQQPSGENTYSSPSNFDDFDGVNSAVDSHEDGYISGQYRTKDFVESDVKCKTDPDIYKDTSCCNVSKEILYDTDGGSNEDPERPLSAEDEAKETNGLLSTLAVSAVIHEKVGADDSKANDDVSSVSITTALCDLFNKITALCDLFNKIRMKYIESTDVWTLEEFLSTADVRTLCQLCANLEHRHTFDPGGKISPKLLFAMLFIVLWYPP